MTSVLTGVHAHNNLPASADKSLNYDSLVLCHFLPYSYAQIADLTATVTGWDTSVVEQLRVAERILTMCRLFNVREGFTSVDDTLPTRFFEPTRGGALSDKSLDFEEMEKAKQYYYRLMGWNEDGVPIKEKLEELGIDHLVKHNRGILQVAIPYKKTKYQPTTDKLRVYAKTRACQNLI